MNTPIVTWGCVVALFALLIVVRAIRAVLFCASGRHRLVDFGSEREELFVPGDSAPGSLAENDYEDFDDL